jgi:hypothetical protein
MTAMATPWLFLGLNFFGYSLLLSMLIPLLDVLYWTTFVSTGCRDKSHRYLIFFVASLVIFWIGWRSPSSLRLFLKFGLITLFIKYVISILENYGTKPFTYAYRLACTVTVIQFLLVNFVNGAYLFDPKALIISLTSSLTLGTGIDAGQYFGVHLWHQLARVGGTALEPGHMALIATVFSPFLIKTFPDRLLLAGAIFASLSKVSFFQLLIIAWGWLAVYIIRAGMLWISIILAYIGISIFFLARYFSSAKDLFAFNPSIYERLQGAILFLNSDLQFKIFGHGYLGVCEHVNSSDIISEHATGYSELVTGGSICNLGVHSLFGSVLLEGGLIGIFAIAICLTLIETRRLRRSEIAKMPIQFVIVLILCGLTSVHWLTNFPPVYVAVALLFAEIRRHSYAS